MWPLAHISPSLCLCSLYVSVVCPGTQNGLSSTGSQENQYNLTKDRYDGCEIIMGNLEITQIESNWDFSFLKVTSTLPVCGAQAADWAAHSPFSSSS